MLKEDKSIGKIAQWVKVLTAKADDVSLTPRSPMVEAENRFPKSVPCAMAHTPTINRHLKWKRKQGSRAFQGLDSAGCISIDVASSLSQVFIASGVRCLAFDVSQFQWVIELCHKTLHIVTSMAIVCCRKDTKKNGQINEDRRYKLQEASPGCKHSLLT